MGGYLVARAAAFEHRMSAIVLDDGVLDFRSAFDQAMPPFLTRWIDDGDPAAAPVMELMIAMSTNIRWAMRNGMWTFGVDTPADLVRAARAYSIVDVADRITCPTLVLDAENDQFFRGQPQLAAKAMSNAPTHARDPHRRRGRRRALPHGRHGPLPADHVRLARRDPLKTTKAGAPVEAPAFVVITTGQSSGSSVTVSAALAPLETSP